MQPLLSIASREILLNNINVNIIYTEALLPSVMIPLFALHYLVRIALSEFHCLENPSISLLTK